MRQMLSSGLLRTVGKTDTEFPSVARTFQIHRWPTDFSHRAPFEIVDSLNNSVDKAAAQKSKPEQGTKKDADATKRQTSSLPPLPTRR